MKILKRVFGLLWSALGFVIGVFLDSLGDDTQSTQKDMYHPDDPYNVTGMEPRHHINEFNMWWLDD